MLRTDALKQRISHVICKYCGGRLEIKRMNYSKDNDNRVELYCPDCDKLEYGVEKEIYELACYMVDGLKFNYYSEIEDVDKRKKLNIAKIGETTEWMMNQLGILNEKGFVYEVSMSELVRKKDAVFTAEQLCAEIGE